LKLIYKQALNIYDPTELFLPKGSKFLYVKSQSNTPMVWYEFDPDIKEQQRRLLRVHTTGENFFSNQIYVGTFEVKMFGQNHTELTIFEMIKVKEFTFVGHVYEEILK